MVFNVENDLDRLVSQFKSIGLGLSLSKFVSVNLHILLEIKKLNVPLKKQSEIVSGAINKNVSGASLSVAISRLNNNSNNIKENIVIIKKPIAERFVDKNAKLIFGTQKEIINIKNKNGVNKEEERLIDWRGLAPNENISSWILEYKNKLIAINLTGWRWKQIAEAINEHLSLERKISVNTLTSIISLSNNKIKQINN